MKMIDVLIKLANGEIEDQTVLEVRNIYTYTFNSKTKTFTNRHNWELSYFFELDDEFLNFDAKLTPPKCPKEKKYLVKINLRGLRKGMEYLNYDVDNGEIHMFNEDEEPPFQTHFTKQELESIQVVREFLEDMKGKYQLIGVDENENDRRN